MNQNISQLQFSNYVGKTSGSVYAHHNGEVVGQLDWARQSQNWPHGEIMHVYVDDAYRRQGLATHLHGMAKELDSTVHHSPTKTKAGKAWAKKVGE